MGTSFDEDSTVISGLVLESGRLIRKSNHNHPNGNTGPSWKDVGVAGMINDRYPDATTSIYTTNPSTYTKYDRNSLSPAAEIPGIDIIAK